VVPGGHHPAALRVQLQDLLGRLAFATRLALLAEKYQHHPVLEVSWGRLAVSFTTDSIGGLSENDYIMAARIDRLD
jgi:4a-hydroxytetrahydrobiopterin dehydratase